MCCASLSRSKLQRAERSTSNFKQSIMAHYFELSGLEALIPADWLLGALDDDSSGTAEMFDQARQAAEDEINGYVGLRYELPLDPVPLFIKSGAVYIAAEVCYNRRSQGDVFPWKDNCKALRALLREIARGETPLYPKTGEGSKAKGSSKAYTEPSKVHSSSGRTGC